MGCLLLVVVIMIGGPLVLFAQIVATGSTSSLPAIIAVLVLGGVFVVLARHYKRSIAQRIQSDKNAP